MWNSYRHRNNHDCSVIRTLIIKYQTDSSFLELGRCSVQQSDWISCILVERMVEKKHRIISGYCGSCKMG